MIDLYQFRVQTTGTTVLHFVTKTLSEAEDERPIVSAGNGPAVQHSRFPAMYRPQGSGDSTVQNDIAYRQEDHILQRSIHIDDKGHDHLPPGCRFPVVVTIKEILSDSLRNIPLKPGHCLWENRVGGKSCIYRLGGEVRCAGGRKRLSQPSPEIP